MACLQDAVDALEVLQGPKPPGPYAPQAIALQDHALAEMITLSIPPLRVGGVRTCQFGYMDGPKLQCLDPNCKIDGCQGNRVEIHTQRVYQDTDADLYKQPLPRSLEFNEPWDVSPSYSPSYCPAAPPPLPLEYEEPSTLSREQHAGCRLAARLLAGAEGSPALEASGSGTSTSDEGGTTAGSSEGDGLISDAELASGSGNEDGGEGSIECEGSSVGGSAGGSAGGVAAAAGLGQRLDFGAAASTGLAADDSGQGATAETRFPLMRCILVHFKTARSKKAISFILPFVVARSLHRWITYGRPLLMNELGGPDAHSALFVSPASGRPMETEAALTYYWHRLQLRRNVPWTPSFPPSAMRHIYVGSRVLKLGELLQAAAVDVSADVMFMTNSLKMWEVRAMRNADATQPAAPRTHTHAWSTLS